MKILTIVESLGLGGTERAAVNYAIGYKNNGVDSRVFAYNKGGIREDVLEELHIPVYIGSNKFEAALENIREWSPEIIHIHRPGVADNKISKILKALKTPKNRILETNVFARVDYSDTSELIDVSLQLSKWCLWKWSRWSEGFKKRPIGIVLPYMISNDNFSPISKDASLKFRAKHNIPSESFLIGRVGQPRESKWSYQIIEVFEKLYKNNLYYLLLVGVPKTYINRIDNLSKEIKDKIIILPLISDDKELRVLYGSLDVFLHISEIGESFGMVLAEAMLCGCPIVTLSTPFKDNSQLEVVGNEIGGLCVATKEHLYEAVEKLRQDVDLRTRIKANLKTWVRERFDEKVVMKQLLSVCKLVLQSHSQEELLRMIRSNEYLISEVDKDFAYESLNNIHGKTPLKTRAILYFLHLSYIYKLYLKVKGINN